MGSVIQSHLSLRELPKLIGFFFSISISNILFKTCIFFSGKFVNRQAKLLVSEQGKAELIVNINYNMNCQEFLKKSEQEKMQQSLQNKKYSFKCQGGPS